MEEALQTYFVIRSQEGGLFWDDKRFADKNFTDSETTINHLRSFLSASIFLLFLVVVVVVRRCRRSKNKTNCFYLCIDSCKILQEQFTNLNVIAVKFIYKKVNIFEPNELNY
jgi:hypothetical protein